MTARAKLAWSRLVKEPLAWIDAHATLPPGRVTPETRATLVLVLGAVILAFMSYGVLSPRSQEAIAGALIDLVALVDADAATALGPYRPLLRIVMWSLGAFTMYFALPALVIRRVFGHRLRDYGLSLRGIRGHLWVYFALFLPVFGLVLLVASTPDFQAKYPFYRTPIGWTDLLVCVAYYTLWSFSL